MIASAPPKPQRSFPILVSGGNNGQQAGNSGTILRSPAQHQQQQQQAPMSPNHVTFGVAAGATASAIRPLPDRPYSVAGQFPGGPMLTHTGHLSGPDRRSFPSDFTPIQSGYISSPERRINQTTVANAVAAGELVRNPLYGTTWYGQPVVEDVYASYPHGIISSRPSSVAGGMVDDLARMKMENMERQLANLTGMVQAALNQPSAPSRSHPQHNGEFIASLSPLQPFSSSSFFSPPPLSLYTFLVYRLPPVKCDIYYSHSANIYFTNLATLFLSHLLLCYILSVLRFCLLITCSMCKHKALLVFSCYYIFTFLRNSLSSLLLLLRRSR